MYRRSLARRASIVMADREIPWHVRVHARMVWPFSKTRWRIVWVRYWESQGISEEQQMQWAAEAEAASQESGSRQP